MKKIIGFLTVLLTVICLSAWGLAADQSIIVNVAETAVLQLGASSVTFTFPTLDTWSGSTNTQTCPDFDVKTFVNKGSANPSIQISSSSLTHTNGTDTIALTGFVVYLKPEGSSTYVSGALNVPVTVNNIGRGRKTAKAHYDLTINDTQQSGQYNGTVTFTLTNI